MSSLRTIEKRAFEELLGMSSGYVLDFTDATFASFISECVDRNIRDGIYEKYGTSKAQRLRAFWDLEGDYHVSKVLFDLIEVWEYRHPTPTQEEAAFANRCKEIARRLAEESSAQVTAQEAEAKFLERDFSDCAIENVPIDAKLIPILQSRFEEAGRSLRANAPLSAIVMCGSVLEGLLLGTAQANPRQFNEAGSSPKNAAGKAKPFREWTLAQLIDVACELNHLKLDVKKFGHAVRDFRNYIHPFEQLSSGFDPDRHTAAICFQVLRAATASLSGQRESDGSVNR